jgi:hypothetical protein
MPPTASIFLDQGTIRAPETETCVEGVYLGMKTFSIITATFFLVLGVVASNGANVQRISDVTGFSVDTLQAERASTGLGWGELENAHLLANALAANGSNLTFDDLVAMHQAGEGWGKIAHDNGLNLGRIVSDAHRSSQAALHAQNTRTIHGKSSSIHGKSTSIHGKSGSVHGRSATNIGKGHTTMMRGTGRGLAMKSGRGGFHGMGGMGHGHGGH